MKIYDRNLVGYGENPPIQVFINIKKCLMSYSQAIFKK